MKLLINRLKASEGVIALLSIGLLMPILILCGYGLYSIFTQGYWLSFAILLAISATLITLPLFFIKTEVKHAEEELEEELEEEGDLVTASPIWGKHDQVVWQKLNQHIQAQLVEDDSWGGLKDHALDIALLVAKEYQRGEWAFSVPESLKMFEEVSRRYRIILNEHVPFVDQIKLSHLKLGLEHKDTIQNSTKTASWLYNAYRIFRISNPYAAAFAEIRGKILSEVFDGVSEKLQYSLKKALLQEVLSVAIDLYSGRFKVDDEALKTSQAHKEDEKAVMPPLEPIRIGVIGQVNCGKSSVINALVGDLVADVNALPSTQHKSIYESQIGEHNRLHLIDFAGLDNSLRYQEELLNEVVHCDLIIWVLRANQSARQLDVQFLRALDKFYQQPEYLSRKRPAIIGVLNQIDRLKPITEWQPPYDLEKGDSLKANQIRQALEYNQELLPFTQWVALCVASEKEHFNVEQLKQKVDEQYTDAMYAQLNRRQHESSHIDLSKQMKRLGRASKSLFKRLNTSKENQNP